MKKRPWYTYIFIWLSYFGLILLWGCTGLFFIKRDRDKKNMFNDEARRYLWYSTAWQFISLSLGFTLLGLAPFWVADYLLPDSYSSLIDNLQDVVMYLIGGYITYRLAKWREKKDILFPWNMD